MPAAKSRNWSDVLDNLGENLIRLGTSLSVLSEARSPPEYESTYAQALEKIATGFRLAFRQARPALASQEKVYLQYVRASVDEIAASHGTYGGGERDPAVAHTLVHEGVLVCQEMVTLLNLIEQGAQLEPDRIRHTFATSAHGLSETTASAGWELRAVCHEHDAETRLAEAGGPSKELIPASMGLLHDMAQAARTLRSARREWFRVGQRISSALGSDAARAGETPGEERGPREGDGSET